MENHGRLGARTCQDTQLRWARMSQIHPTRASKDVDTRDCSSLVGRTASHDLSIVRECSGKIRQKSKMIGIRMVGVEPCIVGQTS